ncbi:PilZ domain-containing protein [Oleiharenicola lentus]|jgi:hypothetical protein|uniref:PilZ domain-containing protein n=1 Tax=Oleiharenicola lentus TaxID=2508720 RepID=A0A4Q1C7Q3_9BACT|nr:PilZ domain-containing protein [Oleiharenicola lentus]RXK54954.1 PilZ domain-containing protein [Oleiharenicola lentus]
MLFFKRILEVTKSASASDRRGGARYAVKPGFPIKTVLNILGRDEQGHLLQSRDGQGWDWTGRLLDISFSGARMQMPRTVAAMRGDCCHLKIDVQGYEVTVPAKIAHIADRRDSFVFGLSLNTPASASAPAFHQLVELIALGATLQPVRPIQPDDSGYLVEEYAGELGSRLVIWRHLAGRDVAAFEFKLKDCLVRGLAGRNQLECLSGGQEAGARPVSGPKGEEIQRLYQWVVCNLAPAVPADVCEFLRKRAA